jgi:hypothetical protein
VRHCSLLHVQECRRQGVGKAMSRVLQQFAFKVGCQKVLVASTAKVRCRADALVVIVVVSS